jgi:uncharacterized protein
MTRLRPAIAAAALVALTSIALMTCGASEEADDAALHRAAARGDLETVRDQLDGGASPDAIDDRGRTAVTAAAYGGHARVVRALVDAGANIDRQDETRANPLLATGETGDVAVLREVLRARPDVTRTNRFGGTALIPAADRGHVDMVRALLRTGIDVDHVNDLGWTALLEAVLLGDGGPRHAEIVGLLVAASADTSIEDRDGHDALWHARERGYDEIAAILERAR